MESIVNTADREDVYRHNGISYHVAEWGDRTDPPLLLLHGFAQSTLAWTEVAPAFAEKRWVVSFDFVGHGKSEKPTGLHYYELDSTLDMLDDFIAGRFDAKTALLGYSMGGRIALAYACRTCDHLTALILESAGLGPGTEEEEEAMLDHSMNLASRLETSSIEDFMEFWENLPMFDSQKRLPPHVIEAIRAERRANDAEALARAMRGLGHHAMDDYSEQIKNLPIPVLYLAGMRDTKYRKVAESLAGEDDICYALFNTGHNTHLEDRETFCRQVLTFLNRHDA